MKAWVAVFSLISSVAFADVFNFKDVEGYEKCMLTDHLVEKTKTGGGEQTQYLSALDVQLKCVESAEKLLSKSKNKEMMKEFIKLTKRSTGQENAIDLIHALVKVDLNACNDIENYEVIAKSLSRPKHDSARSIFQRAKRVTKTCLKDKTFKKDFTEEKDASDSYLAASACEILTEEKIVSSCKKG